MASSSRSVAPDERRAVLEALAPALRSCALQPMVPKLPTKAGRAAVPLYAAPATVARRGVASPSVMETICLRLQRAANVARKRLARAAGGGTAPTLWSEDAVSYGFIINILNPIGHVIGFDDASTAVLLRLSSGRDQAAALDRLCRLEPPFPLADPSPPAEPQPPAEPPAEPPADAAQPPQPPVPPPPPNQVTCVTAL